VTADYAAVAHRAIDLRVQRGWSVDELAARSGLKATRVTQIECGQDPSPDEAEALAAAFGETVESMAVIRDHVWRPPGHGRGPKDIGDRACAYLTCGRPRVEHAQSVSAKGWS